MTIIGLMNYLQIESTVKTSLPNSSFLPEHFELLERDHKRFLAMQIKHVENYFLKFPVINAPEGLQHCIIFKEPFKQFLECKT